jgi:hypothetical protein
MAGQPRQPSGIGFFERQNGKNWVRSAKNRFWLQKYLYTI